MLMSFPQFMIRVEHVGVSLKVMEIVLQFNEKYYFWASN